MRAGGLAAALLAGAALLWPGPAEQAREAATDALMRLAPRPEAPLPVVLLALDEAALSGAPWPWPRTALGALVEAAARAGAAAVAIDLARADAAEGDAALAAALGAVPSVQAALAGEGAPAFGVALLGTPDLAGLARLPGLEAPAVGGAAAGFAGLPGNPVRGVPLLVQAGDQVQPGLALAAVARGLGVATILVRDGTPPRIQLGEVVLPLPRDGMLRLHPARAGVPMVSARGVAALPPGALAGRLAVIGVTAPEAAALRPSVFGAFTPSAVLQAEAAAQLAQGWVPLRPPVARWLEAAAALLLGLLAAFLVRRRAALGLAGGGWGSRSAGWGSRRRRCASGRCCSMPPCPSPPCWPPPRPRRQPPGCDPRGIARGSSRASRAGCRPASPTPCSRGPRRSGCARSATRSRC